MIFIVVVNFTRKEGALIAKKHFLVKNINLFLNLSCFANWIATELNLHEFINDYSELKYNTILCRYIAISRLGTSLTLVAKIAWFVTKYELINHLK